MPATGGGGMIGYARMMLHKLSNNGCHARMREHLALERLPHDELRHRQFWLAATFLKHAYETVPYYRNAMDELGLRPEHVRSFAEYGKLPVLTREVIRERKADLVSSAMPRKVVAALRGMAEGCVPTQVPRDKAARDETQANWLLCLTFAGWTLADMVVRLYTASGAEAGNLVQPGVREWLAGTLSVDVRTHRPEDMAKWVRAIRRCGKSYLLGNAWVMSDMADYLDKAGIRLGNVRGAVTPGGRASAEQRQRIEASFGCVVHDLYGCSEVPCIAMECMEGNLHLLAHSAYVEFDPDPWCGAPCVLVTDINNKAMPVIRFATGDRAVPVDGDCGCGRGFPLMRMVCAAETWFLTAEGRYLPGGDFVSQVARLCGGADVRLRQWAPGEVRVLVTTGDAAALERVEGFCRQAGGTAYPGLSFSVARGDDRMAAPVAGGRASD